MIDQEATQAKLFEHCQTAGVSADIGKVTVGIQQCAAIVDRRLRQTQ